MVKINNISSSEGIQNPKILIESTKAYFHLKVNSISHVVIVQQLWLMYYICSMQHPSLNHLPNFPVQKMHHMKLEVDSASSSSLVNLNVDM
jgi:hypothetical protein